MNAEEKIDLLGREIAAIGAKRPEVLVFMLGPGRGPHETSTLLKGLMLGGIHLRELPEEVLEEAYQNLLEDTPKNN